MHKNLLHLGFFEFLTVKGCLASGYAEEVINLSKLGETACLVAGIRDQRDVSPAAVYEYDIAQLTVFLPHNITGISHTANMWEC